MMDKSFDAAAVEVRVSALWERDRRVQGGPARSRGRRAVLHGHPAAQRDRQPAHGACPQQHAAGHSRPLSADERPRRSLAAGNRPCRDRDPDGGRAEARGSAGAGPADDRPRGVPQEGMGMEGRVGRSHRPAAQAARRLLRLEPGALHSRRRSRRARSPRCSSSFIGTGSSTRTSASSTGTRNSRPRFRIWKSSRSNARGSFKWSRDDGAPLNEAALAKVLARNPNGHLYYFDYPVVDSQGEETGERVTVATTRPETMLGDTAVAVHPDDERYRHLIGRQVRLPLVGRLITIVADEYSDPEKGTGAVKITPAHDFNDFEVGKRHEAEGARQINVLDAEAKVFLKDNVAFFEGLESDHDHDRLIAAVDGQDRFVARLRIVEMMALAGLLAKIEPHAHMVPHGDRSNAVIEPWLTDQWYVDAKTSCSAGAGRRARRRDPVRAEELGEDLLRVAGKYSALVRLPPALVGTSDSRLVLALGRLLRRGNGRSGLRGGARRRRRAGRARRGGGAGARNTTRCRLADDLQARRGRARHLVLLGPVAVLDSRLARRDAGTEALLSDRRSRHRLRHHLLLGRPDDDDGPAFPEADPVPRRLCPRPRPRREGREDVEVEGQRHRPDRPDRPLRRRRAPLHPRRHGGAGPRHQDLGGAGRRLPQFRDQAVERLAFRRDERLRPGRRIRPVQSARTPESLDSGRGGEGGRGNGGSDRILPLQRRRRRGLPIRLERLLRLASGARQAGASGRRGRRGEGGDAGDDRLCARRDLRAPASLHAVPDRGAVGDQGRGRTFPGAGRSPSAPGLGRASRSTKASRPRSAGLSNS